MYRRTDGLPVVVASEFQVVVQCFAVDRLLRPPGLGDCRNPLLRGGVNEVDSCFSVLSKAKYLAESYVLRHVVVHQVKVVPLVPLLTPEFCFHVGHNVVILGVNGHYPAVPGYFTEYFPQMTIGTPCGVECGENFEAGDPRLDRFPDFANGRWRDCARQNVMEREVGVGMSGKRLPPLVDLLHDGIRRWGLPRRYGQVAGKVNECRNPAKGSGTAGCLRGLGDDLRAASPNLGNRNADVSVGLYAAWENYLASGIYSPCRVGFQRAWGSKDSDLLPLNANVHLACA